MAGNQVRIVATAKDNASGPIDRIRNKLAKMEKQGLAQSAAMGVGAAVALKGLQLMSSGVSMAADAISGAVRNAAEFEQGMLNVNSIAKVSKKELGEMGEGVLDMAADFGQSQKGLVKGLYDISSSGFAGTQAMEVLEAATRAASAGLTDAGVSAAGITAVLNAYGMKAGDAAHVSDVMFQTVNRGVVTFEELSSEIGKTTALASPLGISLEEVGAGLAVMTRHGIDAANATTQLNAIMASVLQPSKEAASLAEDLGIEWNTASLRAKGLAAFLADMIKKTGGNHEKMAILLGDVRAIRGAFTLGAKAGQELTDELKEFNDVAGVTNDVLGEQSQGLAFKTKQLDARMEALGIRIGQTAIPPLVDLTDDALAAADAFDVLSGKIKPTEAETVDITQALLDLGSALPIGPTKIAAETFDTLTESLGTLEPAVVGGAAGARILESALDDTIDQVVELGEEALGTADDVEDMADALVEALYGPAELKGELAELEQQLIDDRAELRKLEAIKNPTAETRRDIIATKGKLAETQAEILKTKVDLAMLDGTGLDKVVEELRKLARRTDAAGDEARDLLNTLRKLNGIVLPTMNTGGGGMGKALGGPVTKGVAYTVGEAGPETFVAPANGEIVPNGGLGAMSGSSKSGGAAVVVNFNSIWPPTQRQAAEIARFLRDELDLQPVRPTFSPG